MPYFDWSCKHDILIRNPDSSLSPMDEPWYEAEEIAAGTWKILSSGDFSYLLAGDGQALLIDSGYGAGNIREYCEKLCGLPVPWIANTHEHFDHTANNGYFDLCYMTEKCHDHATEPFQSFSGVEFPRDYPVQHIKTGDVIDLPGRPIEVFELADHSPGGAAYLDRKSRILFCGDEIWEQKPLNTSPAAFGAYLEKIAEHRDSFDTLRGGDGWHKAEVFDALLALCRHAAAGEEGEPAGPRPGPPSEIKRTAEGRIVYDRRMPHPGDGGAGKPRPAPANLRTLRHGNIAITFSPEERN